MNRLARSGARVALVAGGLAAWFLLGAIVLRVGADGPGFKAPVLLQAGVFGCANALLAVGIVLVYRATRVIDFAHAGFGMVAAALAHELVRHDGVSYWIAFPVAILAGGALGAIVEFLFVRRFRTSPRLVLTVATIGIAQLLVGVAGKIPDWMGDTRFRVVPLKTPFSRFRWKMFPIVFTGDHLVLVGVAVAAMAGLALFLGRSRLGMAVRGAAENADRAELLGVDTHMLSTLVWALAGLLAASAAVLQTPITGYTPPTSGLAIGSGGLLLTLAAAVIGGMDDLPVTAAAAIGLSVLSQVVFFVTGRAALVDVAILVVLAGSFIVRRRRLQRTDESAATSWAATEEVRPVPQELAGLRAVKLARRRLVGVLGAVILGYPFVASPSQTNAASLFAIYGIVMVSLVILTGWGGQVSLGQFAFVAVGAVASGSLTSRVGLPFLPALLLGALAGAGVAVLIGLTSLRVRGLYLAVTTLAFAVAMATVGLDRGTFGSILPGRVERPAFLFLQSRDERVFFYMVLAVLGAVWWAALGLRRTRTGRVLIALRENERGAEAFGVNVIRARLSTFALSGFFAALAGGLLASHQHGVNAGYLGPDQSVAIFLTAVIGGLGSIQGALLGAVYMGIVNLAIPGALGQLLANAGGALLILLVFPSGLGGLAYAARDAVLRRIAIRRRIHVPSLFGERGADEDKVKAKLGPRTADRGSSPQPVPVQYRLPSRIRLAGASQRTKTWKL